jgi:S-adenosylmethionine synthetase
MLYTAESVSPKHPDKICDQISDAVVDACLKEDPLSRVAVDVCGGHGIIYITGEVTTKADLNIEQIAKRFAPKCIPIVNIVKQSSEIAQGVDVGGAGDQGIMIGYACDENEDYVPNEYYLARRLNRYLYQHFPFDGKTQVTINQDGVIYGVVASFQNASKEALTNTVASWLKFEATIDEPQILINPAGDWTLGGFDADAGLTGRKLAVDNYGPRIPLGGGAFSGKDPSKVDRSAAYMARHVAVALLKEFSAKEVLVRLAYAIGHTEPVEATAIIDGIPIEIVSYDLTPNGIIEYLNLRQPIYEATASYGHFGRGFAWDTVETI